MMNSVILSCHVGRIFKTPDNETKILRFGVYTVYKGKNGSVFENYTVTVFGDYANYVVNKLVEKAQICVVGRLSASVYKDKSGKSLSSVAIIADSIFFDTEGESVAKQIRDREEQAQRDATDNPQGSASDSVYSGNTAEDESAPF